MNLELVEKWEVHLNHHNGDTSLYKILKMHHYLESDTTL